MLQTLTQPVALHTQTANSSTHAEVSGNTPFALLMGGLIQQTTQVDNDGQAQLEQMIQLIEELMLKLMNQGNEDPTEDLDDEALQSNFVQWLVSDRSIENFIGQFSSLFHLDSKAPSGFSTVLDPNPVNVASFMKVPFAADNANEFSMLHTSGMNDELNALQIKQQIDVLNQLRRFLTNAKEHGFELQQRDVTKIGELLQQISNQISNKPDISRGSHPIETKVLPIKMVPTTMIGMNVTSSTSSGSGSLADQNLSSQLNSNMQEQSAVTTKAGFHQMLASTQVGNSLTSNQVQSNEPTIRAQYVQKDLQDVIVRQLQMTRFPNGVQEAKIRLYPANLGSVEVKLIVQQGVVSAHFIAETKAGKELLDSQLAGLRASLISQGLQVDKLEVNIPQQSNFGHAQDALNREGNQRHEGQRNQSQQQDENDVDFSTLFEEFSEVI